MPAETHQQRGTIEIGELIELMTVLVRAPDDGSLNPGEPLHAVGLGDQASHWALWDAIVDEFGERGSTEAGDADDLVDVETVGELVEVFARWLGWRGDEPSDHRTDADAGVGGDAERRWTGIEPAGRGSPVPTALKAAEPTRYPDTSR